MFATPNQPLTARSQMSPDPVTISVQRLNRDRRASPA
jgi:hypothetical protein